MPSSSNSTSSWTSAQVYIMATLCLLVGIAAGYLIRGPVQTAATTTSAAPTPVMGGAGAQQQPTPEQMKHMADTQAAPLLQRLQSTPRDPKLLADIGNVYYDAQTYPDAIQYYRQSLAIKDDPNVHTDMATAMFYMGDPDGAIAELQKVLKADPTHASALFNLGMIRWQGKMDVDGAITAWQQFLKDHPNDPRKAQVEQLIARAKQHEGIRPGTRTDKPAM
jgi:cytochrome c-type biogenesis protein CcmH/NrfG